MNGRLVRACATGVADGMQIATKSAKAAAAQVEAFNRILSNQMLYCTVCDNNNGNCTVHKQDQVAWRSSTKKNPFSAKAVRGR